MKHKLVVPEEHHYELIQQAHDKLGHKGIFTVRIRLLDRFWWPYLEQDIKWYIKTCHECQTYLRHSFHIPPTVPTPFMLFRKVYIDTMFMPKSNGYRYIVHAQCSLSSFPEWHMLRSENARTLEMFIFEDILCRWGAVEQIVTNNGPAFVQVVEFLSTCYKINHIRISPYNSQANIRSIPVTKLTDATPEFLDDYTYDVNPTSNQHSLQQVANTSFSPNIPPSFYPQTFHNTRNGSAAGISCTTNQTKYTGIRLEKASTTLYNTDQEVSILSPREM